MHYLFKSDVYEEFAVYLSKRHIDKKSIVYYLKSAKFNFDNRFWKPERFV